ncbi:MAG: Serine protease, subtilisin family [Candidatus Methanomarinus sp.]|nr:MAG: Serine protease, subtilisin family [ANME-2 cluster archaeon]
MKNKNKHEIESRKEQYVITICRNDVMEPQNDEMDLFSEILDLFETESDEFHLVQALGSMEDPTGFVVEMSQDGLEDLAKKYGDRILIDPDLELKMFSMEDMEAEFGVSDLTGVIPAEVESTYTIVVEAPTEGPIASAIVYIVGSIGFTKGVTDQNGRVALSLYGETEKDIKTLYVKPHDTYWSLWIDRPSVRAGVDNVVNLKVIEEVSSGTETYTWGQKAMALNKIPNDKLPTGRGIKVAVIDSGIFVDHEDLEAAGGRNLTATGDPATAWKNDIVGHGTHVSGITTALRNGKVIFGMAPNVMLYSLRIFPGGKLSSLIAALMWCIENEIDVVNLSLGTQTRPDTLEQKIREAHARGVACIAAAGNDKGPVNYPAKYDQVLAVAAIGQGGTFPSDSRHARHAPKEVPDDVYFSAVFTSHGNEIDVCAPGVAIVSTVNIDNAYAAWDGTSMACPHITGLAAQALGVRSDLRKLARGGERVNRLFEVIKESAKPIVGIGEEFQGAGLPNAKLLIDEQDGQEPWEQLLELLESALKIAQKQVGGAGT